MNAHVQRVFVPMESRETTDTYTNTHTHSPLARYLFATNATRLAIMSDLGIIVRETPPAAV